ncbi:MAG: ABC transporter ATP-binding protein [Pseudomonadota bacterium]
MSDLKIADVKKAFGETEVLKGISLNISDGEFVSLVGPSGCGKSTLLRIIAGLEQQSSGNIRIGGGDVSRVRAADRNLSMVFQSYALYPHLTVAENISVPLKMRQLSALQRLPLIGAVMPGAKQRMAQIGQAVQDAAKTLEIAQLLDRKPGQLSGGQRQRVALGRALVREPAAFLLDEPLSNLDAKLRVQTRSEIAQLHRRLGATFVYVTHDQVEAMTMSDRIAVMMGGEILQCDAPHVVYDDPNDIRVAEFIGSPKINIIPVDALEDSAKVMEKLSGLLGAGDHLGIRLGARPEAVKLSVNPDVVGQVTHMENLGSEIFAQAMVPGLLDPVVFRASPADRAKLTMGKAVGLSFEAANLLVFDGAGRRVRESGVQAPAAEVA